MARSKLKPRHLVYCQARAAGDSYAEAYKKAGFGKNSNETTRMVNAYHMETGRYDKGIKSKGISEEIQAEIKRLQEMADKNAILKREERQALLTEIALDKDNDMPDRLRSLDQLNRMSGDYTEKIQTEVSGHVQMTFEEKIAAIQASLEK